MKLSDPFRAFPALLICSHSARTASSFLDNSKHLFATLDLLPWSSEVCLINYFISVSPASLTPQKYTVACADVSSNFPPSRAEI